VCFQGKDYERLLHTSGPLPRNEADWWFEEFNNVAPHERHRGFRR
jgi:hypothetical protein